MRLEIKRRTFLKGGALAATGALLPGCFRSGTSRKPEAQARLVPSYCEVCFWKCGLFAKVVDGEVVALQGNPKAPQNNGRLCARGNAGTGFLYDRDRLRAPMRRTGPRGSGKFEEITWGEALDEVASKLRAVAEDRKSVV